jgi:CheY-like chemotaxis protein
MNTPEEKAVLFYVDDDSDDRFFFEEAAHDINENVRLFETGDQMLESLRHPPPSPSIVFIDLNMPLKNGFEVLQEIRSSEAFRSVPIVVYSTSGEPNTITRCLSLGASFYMTKAIRVSALRKAIDYLLHIDWTTFKPDLKNFVYNNQ